MNTHVASLSITRSLTRAIARHNIWAQ